MEIITKSGTTVNVEEIGIIGYTTKTFLGPFTGQPSTATQTWIFGSTLAVLAAGGTYLFSRKRDSKIASDIGSDLDVEV